MIEKDRLAFYYNEDGICTFLDSFGLEPYVYGLQEYLNKTSLKWIYNDTQLHNDTQVLHLKLVDSIVSILYYVT